VKETEEDERKMEKIKKKKVLVLEFEDEVCFRKLLYQLGRAVFR